MLPRRRQIGIIVAVAAAMVAIGDHGTQAQQTGKPEAGKRAPSKASAKRKGGKAPAARTEKSGAAEAPAKLDKAAAALAGNKPDEALRGVNEVLSSNGVAPHHVARALYLRGLAYRKQGKPAQAMADLSSAIWLKGGLGDADRAAATKARNEAAREAGIVEPSESDSGPPRLTAGPAPASRPARPATTSGWETGTTTRARSAAPAGQSGQAPAPNAPSGGGVGDFFSGLFGGGTQAPAREPAASGPSVGQPWSSTTRVKSADPAGSQLGGTGTAR